jgi:hypothetical protein
MSSFTGSLAGLNCEGFDKKAASSGRLSHSHQQQFAVHHAAARVLSVVVNRIGKVSNSLLADCNFQSDLHVLSSGVQLILSNARAQHRPKSLASVRNVSCLWVSQYCMAPFGFLRLMGPSPCFSQKWGCNSLEGYAYPLNIFNDTDWVCFITQTLTQSSARTIFLSKWLNGYLH